MNHRYRRPLKLEWKAFIAFCVLFTLIWIATTVAFIFLGFAAGHWLLSH